MQGATWTIVPLTQPQVYRVLRPASPIFRHLMPANSVPISTWFRVDFFSIKFIFIFYGGLPLRHACRSP